MNTLSCHIASTHSPQKQTVTIYKKEGTIFSDLFIEYEDM